MQKGRTLGGKRVFVLHGTDSKSRDVLVHLLKANGLEPVVLAKEKVAGATTIIEKFERVGCTCNYAIALLTPDDKSFEQLTGEERFRARQNVFIELGWFMAFLGRQNVYIVVVGDIEMPSDIVGIEVSRCNSTINGKSMKLKKFISGIGKH